MTLENRNRQKVYLMTVGTTFCAKKYINKRKGANTVEDKEKQVAMHKEFFDRAEQAIQHGYYLEAVFIEYAAIEGRLEVLLGVLGAPCNKKAADKDRRKVDISHRITCLKKIYKDISMTGNTKLDANYFKKLDKWIKDRNTIVHGYYKNELCYRERSAKNRELAVNGLELANMLYNEAKRLRRYKRAHHDADLSQVSVCYETSCNLNGKMGGKE